MQSYQAAIADFIETERNGWQKLPFFSDGEAAKLAALLDQKAAAGTSILPAPGDIFNALKWTPLADCRVVILGQDPYPTLGDAHGLAFSVNSNVPIPRSLNNIFKELESDLGQARPSHGNLTAWAKQGVLLLNTCLTVEAGKAGSHRNMGWEKLTDQMIQAISVKPEPVIFILWGADAQRKAQLIDDQKHLIITSPHPSPLSAARGFFNSKPFSQTNEWLKARGLKAIDWRL
jgi:uracil-DNA glycosylase